MPWKLSHELFALAAIATIVVMALVIGPSLPDQVPTHFNGDGVADSYSSRPAFLYWSVGLTAGIYLLLTFVPLIDPFWKTIKPRYHLLTLLRDFVLGFSVAIFLLTVLAARDGRLPTNLLGVCIGVLIALIGNYLPRVPRNWFFGIRTPWTLASDVVWVKSHRVGGWMFVIAGVVLAVASVLGVPAHIALIVTILPPVVVAGFIYPFILLRRLQHDEMETAPDLSTPPTDHPNGGTL